MAKIKVQDTEVTITRINCHGEKRADKLQRMISLY